jgi:WD40 repeat protein
MISIWDLNNEKMAQQSQLQAHRRPITDMNWSPFQQHLLATCSTDSYVFLWDIRDPNNPLKGKYFRAYSGTYKQFNTHDHILIQVHKFLTFFIV